MGQLVFNGCTSLTNIEIGTGDNPNSTSLKVAVGLFNGVDLTNITLTVKAGVGTVNGNKWTIATTNTATGKKTFTFKDIIVVP